MSKLDLAKKYAVSLVLCAGVLWPLAGNAPVEALQDDPAQARFQFIARLNIYAQQAISEDAATAQFAINALRDAGPEGVQVLLKAHEQLLENALRLSPQERAGHPQWKRLKNALDKVGAQCDNWASKLYWYTDLEKAKAQAQKANKPILSLRLLGNLDDELSCANSRFFRTALYPNAEINALLREYFVLHWESVRPVPKVTIDFGDGRKIQTTITGNSIHYALDPQGRVLDGLPGLYGPRAFMQWLNQMRDFDKNLQSAKTDDERTNQLRTYHQTRLAWNTQRWQNDLGHLKLGETFAVPAGAVVGVSPGASNNSQPRIQQTKASGKMLPPKVDMAEGEELMTVTARRAGGNAYAKAMVEMRTLKEITVPLPRDRSALQRNTTDVLWSKIATLHEAEAKLDENSLKVLRAKSLNPDKAAFSFEKSIAEDTIRNEYSRHATLHEWLKENPNIAVEELNKRVYAELFLTPDSDPWLGLLPTDAYTAIQNDGVVKSNG